MEPIIIVAMVKLVPAEGSTADREDVLQAIEQAIADILTFDVDSTDGTEQWTVDEVTV